MATASIAKLSVHLGLNTADFNRALRDTQNRLLQYNKQVSQTIGTQNFIGQQNIFRGGQSSHASQLSSLLRLYATARAGMAIFRGTSGAFESMTGTATKFETLNVTMAALAGSAEKAGEMIAGMVEKSSRLPVDLEAMTVGTQRLLAYGFAADQATGIMDRLLDITSTLPGDLKENIEAVTLAIGQMAGKSRVMTQEMNQLTERGIAAWKLMAREIGKSEDEIFAMVENREIDAATGIRAILSRADDPEVKGLLAKRAGTLAGLRQIRSSVTQQFMREVGGVAIEALGLKDHERVMTQFFQQATQNAEALRQPLLAIGGIMAGIRDVMLELIKATTVWASELTKGIEPGKSTFMAFRTLVINVIQDISDTLIGVASLIVSKLGAALSEVGFQLRFFNDNKIQALGEAMEGIGFRMEEGAKHDFGTIGTRKAFFERLRRMGRSPANDVIFGPRMGPGDDVIFGGLRPNLNLDNFARNLGEKAGKGKANQLADSSVFGSTGAANLINRSMMGAGLQKEMQQANKHLAKIEKKIGKDLVANE